MLKEEKQTLKKGYNYYLNLAVKKESLFWEFIPTLSSQTRGQTLEGRDFFFYSYVYLPHA